MVDDLVQKSLARWPNVPALAGWLKLTEQGQWLLTGPVPEGLTISNERILNFIARNYECDEQGRYYFQNGPQKAYVTLAIAPWVYRLYPLDSGELMLVTHTGLVVRPDAFYQDELGRIFLLTEVGVGLLHGSDTSAFAIHLKEKPDSMYVHEAIWVVPKEPSRDLPRSKVEFRRAVEAEVGAQVRSLPVQTLQSDQLAEQFSFVLEPEV